MQVLEKKSGGDVSFLLQVSLETKLGVTFHFKIAIMSVRGWYPATIQS
jgi:hypothetical protein